ncbi:MAG TPA: hypothetical protein VFZ72_03480 [Jiangellaceae bacterium]
MTDRKHPAPLGHDGATASLRAQILATEHWSLLATRSMTWNEIFSRTSIFLTVLSATVVALSLVAVHSSGFGHGFRVFALSVLPIALLVGLATYIRLIEADIEDVWLVAGMNRLRQAYLELAPDLDPYFVTSHHDDELGVLQTYSFRRQVGVIHLLSGSPVIVGIIDTVLSAVLAAIACQAVGAPGEAQVAAGLLAAVVTAAMLAALGYRRLSRLRRDYRPRFPS